jgi:hypothetical protein
MGTLKQYEEKTTRIMKLQGKEVGTGHVVRTVSISEADAKIMNGQPEHGFEYVLKSTEPTAKEIRAALVVKAEGLGLTFKKNISTPDLQKLVDENTPAEN